MVSEGLGTGIGKPYISGLLKLIKLIKKTFSYPGLHCDVEAYIYLPLLEETGYMPSKKYVSGAEIRSYLIDLVKRFDLEDKIMFRTKVNGLQWSDDLRAWRADLTTSHGIDGKQETHLWTNAEFVLLTTGLFPRPQVPKLPGLTGFEGTMFHTARWNYTATGGSSEEPFPVMDKLKDKRVGIIGTGATAIQIVPEVAK